MMIDLAEGVMQDSNYAGKEFLPCSDLWPRSEFRESTLMPLD